MCINSNSTQHMNDQYGLDRSTFKFMIESDETIKVHSRLYYIEFVENLSSKNISTLWSAAVTNKIADSADL